MSQKELLARIEVLERANEDLRRESALLRKDLAALERQYQTFLEVTEDAVFIMDLEGNFLSLNVNRELIGRNLYNLLPADQAEAHRRMTEEVIATGRTASQVTASEVDGARVWSRTSLHAVHDADGKVVALLGITRNVTHVKEAEEEIERLNISDPLTHLYNQRYFRVQIEEEAKRAKRHNRPLALILLDVDHLSSYNLRFSHHEGDNLLAALAQELLRSIREVDLPFRYGGGEFAVLLPDTDAAHALAVAERVRSSAADLHTPSALRRASAEPVTVSIGVARLREGVGPVQLERLALEAMRASKAAGGNQITMSD